MKPSAFTNLRREQLHTQTGDTCSSTADSDFLTLRFFPGHKYLEACWQRPVNSKEYRQGIRSIAVCVATLQARLLLINLTQVGTPSTADQYWTASFLQQVIRHSSLSYCARVLSEEANQLFAHENVVGKVQHFPYTSKAFPSEAEAREWLRQEAQFATSSGDGVSIPLHFSLQDLRKIKALAGEASSSPPPSLAVASDLVTFSEFRCDYVEIIIDRKHDLLSLRWLRPPQSREYRYGILKACRALIGHKLGTMLINNQKLGIPTLAEQAWLAGTVIQWAGKFSLKKLAILSSPDSLQQLASEAIQSKLNKVPLPYQIAYFLSEKEAQAWLQSP